MVAGVWFMHCHLEVHTTWGLKMAFLVENGKGPNQSILPPPSDLPKCWQLQKQIKLFFFSLHFSIRYLSVNCQQSQCMIVLRFSERLKHAYPFSAHQLFVTDKIVKLYPWFIPNFGKLSVINIFDPHTQNYHSEIRIQYTTKYL